MANPQVAKTSIRGYPGPSPEGSEVVDDGRSRSSLEDALSRHTTHPPANHTQPEAAHRPPLELGATLEVPEPLVEAIAQRVAQLLLRPTDVTAPPMGASTTGASMPTRSQSGVRTERV